MESHKDYLQGGRGSSKNLLSPSLWIPVAPLTPIFFEPDSLVVPPPPSSMNYLTDFQ